MYSAATGIKSIQKPLKTKTNSTNEAPQSQRNWNLIKKIFIWDEISREIKIKNKW